MPRTHECEHFVEMLPDPVAPAASIKKRNWGATRRKVLLHLVAFICAGCNGTSTPTARFAIGGPFGSVVVRIEGTTAIVEEYFSCSLTARRRLRLNQVQVDAVEHALRSAGIEKWKSDYVRQVPSSEPDPMRWELKVAWKDLVKDSRGYAAFPSDTGYTLSADSQLESRCFRLVREAFQTFVGLKGGQAEAGGCKR